MVIKITWKRALPALAALVLSVGVVSFVGSNQTSAYNRPRVDTRYYLKIDGIAGDSVNPKHKGEIELNSYRIMEDEPDTATARDEQTNLSGLGDNNLRFLAEASKASPLLFQKASTNEVIASATLTVSKTSNGRQQDYITMRMSDVIISNYQNSGNGDNDSVDEVVFDYGTITIEHNEGSPLKKGWDFRKKQEL